jgi:hypothetical protein
MPNGHGGMPAFGTPVLLAVLFAVVVRASPPHPGSPSWVSVTICLVIAALFGWKMAYHVHMRAADAYGGGYTPPEDHARSLRRYRMMSVVYVLGSLALGAALLRWRGLL